MPWSSNYLTERHRKKESEGGLCLRVTANRKTVFLLQVFSPHVSARRVGKGATKVGVPPVALNKIEVNSLQRLETMFSGNKRNRASCEAVGQTSRQLTYTLSHIKAV